MEKNTEADEVKWIGSTELSLCLVVYTHTHTHPLDLKVVTSVLDGDPVSPASGFWTWVHLPEATGFLLKRIFNHQ